MVFSIKKTAGRNFKLSNGFMTLLLIKRTGFRLQHRNPRLFIGFRFVLEMELSPKNNWDTTRDVFDGWKKFR